MWLRLLVFAVVYFRPNHFVKSRKCCFLDRPVFDGLLLFGLNLCLRPSFGSADREEVREFRLLLLLLLLDRRLRCLDLGLDGLHRLLGLVAVLLCYWCYIERSVLNKAEIRYGVRCFKYEVIQINIIRAWCRYKKDFQSLLTWLRFKNSKNVWQFKADIVYDFARFWL